jgi:hypothetical protein
VDKHAAARRIRKRLEQRLANFLGCESHDLAPLKLGTLIHALFLFEGDTEVLPGFNTAMGAILQLLGKDIVWMDVSEKTEESEEKVVVN